MTITQGNDQDTRITIDVGIPFPEDTRSAESKYPFAQMDVGHD